MSIQFNFFATEQDEELIVRELVAQLGATYAFPDRVPLKDMVPRRILKGEDLAYDGVRRKVNLVRECDLNSVVIAPVPRDLYWISQTRCACIEYCPSAFIDHNTISLGRFAFFFVADSDLRVLVEKYFRRLRKIALRIPNSRSFWIFENAAEAVPKLAYSSNSIESNPFCDLNSVQ